MSRCSTVARSTIALMLAALSSMACGAAMRTEPAAVELLQQQGSPAVSIVDAPDEGVRTRGALLAPMPQAVTSFGATVAGGYAYVLGGYFGVPHQYNKEGQSRQLWRLDLSDTGHWQRVSELAAGVQGLALVAHGREICRVGGNRIVNAAGEPAKMQSLTEAACYHTERHSWRTLPPLPEGRSSHEAAVVDGVLFVAGGWQLGSREAAGAAADGRFQRDVLALDLNKAGASWHRIAAPFTRRAVGVASAGGKLVVVGGLSEDGKSSRQVEVYDPQAARWSEGPAFPSDAFGAAAVGAGDQVYASARDGMVYRWRVGDSRWSELGALSFPRFFHQLVVHDGQLVALGGIGGMHSKGRTRQVERMALNGGRAMLAEWLMAQPGAAKNRQGMFLHGDDLYLFGGNTSLAQHDFEPDNFVAESWRLNLPSLKWERLADYPFRRQTMQTLSLGGLGVSVGGFGHDGTAAVSHSQAQLFDFDSGSWRSGPDLPRGRTQFGLAEYAGKLWAFGGLNYDPSRPGKAAFEHVTNTLVAAPAGDETGDSAGYQAFGQAGVVLPSPRRAFAGARLGDSYYLIGGMREGFALVEDCLVYDFPTRTFRSLPCPRRNRLSAELVALGDKLLLVGGAVKVDGRMTADRSIEMYDTRSQTWRLLLNDIGFDTKHLRAVRYRDRLLLWSTHNAAAQIRLVLIDPAATAVGTDIGG